MFIQKKKSIAAAEEVEVEVAEEASDLLFEAEDVAELIAEVTGEPVDVAVDGDDVIFTVAEDEFVVTAEGDEEVVESSTRTFKKPVKAGCDGRKEEKKAPVKSSRTVRKVRK